MGVHPARGSPLHSLGSDAGSTLICGGVPGCAPLQQPGPEHCFGQPSTDLVNKVLATGQRFTDMANSGNVNVLMGRPDGGAGLIRVTLDPAEQRVISGGMMRASQVAQYIANGRLVAR